YSIWTMQSNYHNLPLINGVPQKFGAKYKATEVEFSPSKKQFTANIATAYPEEAQVESWKRSYRLDNGGLVIKDNFKLKTAKENNRIHFLSYGDISLDMPGKVIINVNDKQIAIEYDKQAFQVDKEAIALDDKRLSNVWGDTIYRLVFTAQDSKTEGNYQFKVVKL
ncbi:MAG: heparinase, partial [Tannerellaceae bacterium]